MPLSKDMSFEEIVKKEIAAGKDQKQAVAIAYKVTGKDKKGNNLTWRDRLNMMGERIARGTQRYSSKKNEDEASEEEHEIEQTELERKRVGLA